MSDVDKKHGAKVLSSLDELERLRLRTIKLGGEMLRADGGSMFQVDLLAVAAIKRCLSNTAAIRLLVESWNLVAARTMLRAHLDTPLRFSAVWLVNAPHDFAERVHAGEHIRRLKDRDGKRMTDAYLIEKMSADHPWLTVVYDRLSGYVHFSANHLSASITGSDDDNRVLNFELSEQDMEFPESSWIEVVLCFNECTRILHRYLEGWILTKSGSPAHGA